MYQISNERGFSLVMVMAMMVILALMIVAGARFSNTELRISANDADRKFAFSLAEKALRAGEEYANESMRQDAGDPTSEEDTPENIAAKYTNNCTNGLCSPADGTKGNTVAAWERENVLTGKKGDPSRSAINKKPTSTSQFVLDDEIDPAVEPRYIVEYLGESVADKRVFRVTARAWGESRDTFVTLQSYVAAPQ